jgi:tripartite-type tricarboxylate transporter receptor subunit TctC
VEELGIIMKGVPFRGAAALVGDLADGRIPAAVSGMVSLLQHHRGGRVKLLITTGSKRRAVAKGIPTARELGYASLEVVVGFACYAKAGTAAPVIDEWNRQLRTVLDDGNLKRELVQLGLDVETSTPQEVTARVISHQKEWKARMQSIGMQPINRGGIRCSVTSRPAATTWRDPGLSMTA